MEHEQLEVQESKDTEFKLYEPKVVQSGECDHYYNLVGTDPEGLQEVQCSKCWVGRRITSEYKVEDGRIKHK